MKKIYYSFTTGLVLAGLALSGLLGGCEKVNDQFNQHELDSLTNISNVATYNYTFVSADYKTIGDVIQKPIADAIKVKEDALKVAVAAHNTVDSTTLANDIKALKLDPTYVQGGLITSVKYLPISALVADNGYLILNAKFKVADEGSVTMVTYNAEFDSTSISNKASMTAANYDAMGTSTGYPGKDNCFSSSISATYYIPIFLKQSFPYAKVGDTWLIRYRYNTTGTTYVTRWLVSVYDGTTWSATGNLTPTQAKFVVKEGTWKYINTDILVGLKTGIGSNLGDFIPISVTGDQVWAWNSYNYMMITGYLTPNYLNNDDWLVSPAMDLTERSDSTFLTFSHTGKYFGTDMLAGAKKQATVWISTTSDGTSINMSDWTQLTLRDTDYNFGTGWVWNTVKPVKLSDYSGKANVRIAFRYLSQTSDGWAGTYQLKNVYVFEKD